MKNILLRLIDFLLFPLTLISAILFKFIRRAGFKRMTISRRVCQKVGVMPVRNHYYEPFLNPAQLRKPLQQDRELPGISLNVEEQLQILEKFHFNDELIKIPLEKPEPFDFHYHNGTFCSGDAEYWYNIIRLMKPSKIVEIGSGYSTLLAIKAIAQNQLEDKSYSCSHICIEPFRAFWLDNLNVKVIRERVELTKKSLFENMNNDDILFIDSSHIIRPQGDVLFLYLEILPVLKKGVIVHVHDIFAPKDYPAEWMIEEGLFWNEQYLLEAFLSLNSQFKIIGALNYLKHHYFQELSSKCPILKNESAREPGSFYLRKIECPPEVKI